MINPHDLPRFRVGKLNEEAMKVLISEEERRKNRRSEEEAQRKEVVRIEEEKEKEDINKMMNDDEPAMNISNDYDFHDLTINRKRPIENVSDEDNELSRNSKLNKTNNHGE